MCPSNHVINTPTIENVNSSNSVSLYCSPEFKKYFLTEFIYDV